MADEPITQTVARNITPEVDTSKTALGPGGMFTSGQSPQAAGEQQYKEALGSPQEVAMGKIKNWLSEHEQHFSDKVLKPFRQGLDNMADEIDASPVVKAASPVAQGVAKGTAELMRQVPVGKDVKSTAQAMISPPELGAEKKILDFSKIEGHKLIEEAPEYAYRARDIGEKGVPAEAKSHAQATMSADEAKMYVEHRGKTTGKPQELVRFNLNKLDPEHYVRKNGPGTADWVKLNRALKEEEVEKMPAKPEKGAEPEDQYEIRTRTQGGLGGGGEPPAKPKKPLTPEEKPSPKKIIEDAGLVYKGELSKGSGVHMFEHPDHPGKTAALNEDQINYKAVQDKMAGKLKEFGVKPLPKKDKDQATKGL